MVVHTEQFNNTDHPGSVVFLLEQKQLFQDCLFAHAHCKVHGCPAGI